MTTINRVTPEMVLAAYEKTGLAPIRGAWLEKQPNRECGCALSAMLCATAPDQKERLYTYATGKVMGSVRELLTRNLDLPRRYIDGFIAGFDDAYSSPPSSTSINCKLGHEDGQAAGEAVTNKYGYEHFN